MGRTFARDGPRAFIAQSTQIDAVQEMLPGAEQDGSDGEMQLVDQAGPQILPNRGHAATEADIAAAGCRGRLLQGSVNAFGDEAKLRLRRLLAPPALSAVIRPRASDAKLWTRSFDTTLLAPRSGAAVHARRGASSLTPFRNASISAADRR